MLHCSTNSTTLCADFLHSNDYCCQGTTSNNHYYRFNGRCPMTVGGYHEPNVILKDNDLKHKIRLPTDSSKTVLTQVSALNMK